MFSPDTSGRLAGKVEPDAESWSAVLKMTTRPTDPNTVADTRLTDTRLPPQDFQQIQTLRERVHSGHHACVVGRNEQPNSIESDRVTTSNRVSVWLGIHLMTIKRQFARDSVCSTCCPCRTNLA